MQSIPAKDGDIEVPIPSRDEFLSVVQKVARSAPQAGRIPDQAHTHEQDSDDDEGPSGNVN